MAGETAPATFPKGPPMSDTPSTDDRKRSDSFPDSIGAFLALFVILTLMWATGSWLAKKYDWADHGGFQAPLGHLVGTIVGGAMSTFAQFSLPMLLWRLGRSIPRRAYIRVSTGLLLCGLATLSFVLWVPNGAGPVQTLASVAPDRGFGRVDVLRPGRSRTLCIPCP